VFSEINAKLVAIHEELRKKEKYQTQLEDYKRELQTIKETLFVLMEQLESEQHDVEKLEGFSLANLLATLFGKKEEKLSKEKQELIAAQHRLEQAKKTKENIDAAILVLRNKMKDIGNVEEAYQQLLLQKEESIITSSSPLAAKVFGLSEKEGTLKAYIIELGEAISAGKRVEHALSDAIGSLEKAQNWGTWDILGGGMLADMGKHQNIDQAEAHIRHAQTCMRQFQKELLDVQGTAQLEVNVSGMLKFADFFFDGFIADFMVQGKINNSLDQTRSQLTKVKGILGKLKAQYGKKKRELEDVQKEKQELVEEL
jgi:chromosome segregation ATPase